jgi:hypothetical protein
LYGVTNTIITFTSINNNGGGGGSSSSSSSSSSCSSSSSSIADVVILAVSSFLCARQFFDRVGRSRPMAKDYQHGKITLTTRLNFILF